MNRRPLIAAGILIGAGLGGFLDGILFHQILQLHSMLTAIYPKDVLVNYQVNMFWDGLFHALTWAMTVIGLAVLWKAGANSLVPWSGKTFGGSLIVGWGLFNFIEGVINHHLLGIHHVVEALGTSIYDYAFLASGVAMVVVGISMIRSATAKMKSMDGTRGTVAAREPATVGR